MTTFVERFAEAVARDPGALAITGPDHDPLTYAELDAGVQRARGWLAQRGTVPGQRVVLRLPTGLSFVLLHLAALRSGLVVIPANPRGTADELAGMLDELTPHLLVGDEDAAELLQAALVQAGHLADQARLPRHELFEDAPPPPLHAEPPPADALACLISTSGTTGRPKGAMLTHGNLGAWHDSLALAWEWSSEDVLLHVLPLFHVHGLCVALHGALGAGARVELQPRFDERKVWERLRWGEVTVFMGVPTHYHRLLEAAPEEATLPALRLMTCGSAPLPPRVLEGFAQLTGQRLLERYGMTEVGMAAGNPLHGERVAGAVGSALPGVRLRVVDRETREPLPAGEVGEVEIGGPGVFAGYWNRQQASDEAFTPDGYMRSGDLGSLDEQGVLRLSGRAKELIISGGFNIYPKEVETVLDEHAAVKESAVVGLPDDDMGEVVVAAVVLREGPEMIVLADVARHACARLAAYKLPQRYSAVDALPRNAMGKLDRARAAEMVAEAKA